MMEPFHRDGGLRLRVYCRYRRALLRSRSDYSELVRTDRILLSSSSFLSLNFLNLWHSIRRTDAAFGAGDKVEK
jgi:hypothetical protein